MTMNQCGPWDTRKVEHMRQEQNLGNEISRERRNVQRHIDLLNEVVSRTPDEPRLHELFDDLSNANGSMNHFQ